MRKKALIGVLATIIVVLLAKSAYVEYVLRREMAAITECLSQNQSRFARVEVYRGKSDHNVVSGQVLSTNDVEFLRQEMVRMGIRRCVFAVRADEN